MNPLVGILADIVHLIRLCLFAVLDLLGMIIRPVLAGLGLLGFLMCGFYALVAPPKMHFPQGQMLAIAGGFIGAVVLYDLITYAIKPKGKPND